MSLAIRNLFHIYDIKHSPHTVTKTFENGHLSIIQINQDIIAHASKCATQHEEHEQYRNIHFKKYYCTLYTRSSEKLQSGQYL